MTTYAQRTTEDYETTKLYELSILHDGEKIGYAELFVVYDEDGDEASAYVKSIEIAKEHRNCGYGTEILNTLAQEHDGIYICPDNEGADRLYQRLGEEVDYTHCPDELAAELDEYGAMYYIG